MALSLSSVSNCVCLRCCDEKPKWIAGKVQPLSAVMTDRAAYNVCRPFLLAVFTICLPWGGDKHSGFSMREWKVEGGRWVSADASLSAQEDGVSCL